MRLSRMVFVLMFCVVCLLAFSLVGCSSGSSGGLYGGSGGSTTTGSTGSGSSGGASAGGTTITMENFAFNPASATVKVGDTVTFVNKDSVDHHVFVGSTDLGVQASGASTTWKAAAAGNFPIKCVIHPSMTGDITVQ